MLFLKNNMNEVLNMSNSTKIIYYFISTHCHKRMILRNSKNTQQSLNGFPNLYCETFSTYSKQL